MDTSSWRVRVLLEPRGFIRLIEWVLSIVAFATTSGFQSVASFHLQCDSASGEAKDQTIQFSVQYPFALYHQTDEFFNCSSNKTEKVVVQLEGDLSPSSQWFVCVGVLSFLFTLAAMVFYVAFDATVRQTNERLVTIGDLAITVLFAFFWLTAAASWAWGLGQVKYLTSYEYVKNIDEYAKICADTNNVCRELQMANFSPLNASVAFGFLNFFLWCSNVWFVYKESPYHVEPAKSATSGESFPQASAAPSQNTM